MKRDIQLHMAVTITPNVNNVQMIGQKEQELNQWAVQYDAKELPVKESAVQKSFTEFYKVAIKEMRKAGVVR